MLRRLDWAMALFATMGALGCSDPVPAAAAVGLRLTVNSSSTCATMAIDDDIGNPPPDSMSTGNPGKRVYDGEAGVAANCSVTGSGPFAVSARITSGPKRISFVMSNGTVNQNGTGTAQIALSGPNVPNSVSSSSTPCTITAVRTNVRLEVNPGSIWATFNCPKLEDPPSTSCQAFGEFVLENCSK